MEIIDQIKQKLAKKTTDWYRHNHRRVYFRVSPIDIKVAASVLFKDLGLRFITASGLEVPEGFEIVYHFGFDKTGLIVSVKVKIEDKKTPGIDSIAPIIRGAEWIEREMWELLGIDFKGHPDLKHLLLIDDWPKDDFPLRRTK